MNSLFELFENFARQQPDKFFMYDESRCFTAKTAFASVKHVAAKMYSTGVRAGEIVAIRATRSIDTMFIFFAVQFLGAVACLTDPHCGVVKFIANSGVNISPEWYVTNEAAHSDINALGDWLLFGKKGMTEINITESEGKADFAVSLETEQPAAIIFTSGSTGKSKGVVLSQRNLVCHMQNYEAAGCFKPFDNSIELLPVHHVFGLTIAIYALFTRYGMFFPKCTDVDYIAECIGRYKITRLDIVPSYALALCALRSNHYFDTTSLRVGLIGGAPSTKEQFDYIEATLGLKLVPVYGMSECVAITGIPLEEPSEKRAATVGKFLPMHDGFISDGKGGRSASGIEGEICVKSPVVMMGYYGDKEATDKVIDKDGALHTGDIGYVDGEGYVHVTGRLKDIIIRNGVNLSASKIENKILSLPFVENAAIVAKTDDSVGEIPCAMVALKKGCHVTVQQILAETAKILTKPEIPVLIEITDKLPLTSSGKPDKQAIKKFFREKASC